MDGGDCKVKSQLKSHHRDNYDLKYSWHLKITIFQVNTELNQDVTDVIVVANLTDRQTETGWLYLDITSNEAKDDQDQALAAGIAEGYLTSNAIYGYYKEFIHKGFCTVDPQFCEFIREKFQQNLNWIKEITKVQNSAIFIFWAWGIPRS